MKIHFTAEGNIQTAGADGITTYHYQAGETIDVPADIAALFLEAGVVEPAKADKAVKPKGETATK